MKRVRFANEPVAEMRAGLDFVAERAQCLDARPDRRAADPQLTGDVRARDPVEVPAQGGQDFGVGGHSKSKPMSTARAEWVRAPTGCKRAVAVAGVFLQAARI